MKKKIDVTALGEILIDFTKEGIESDLSFAGDSGIVRHKKGRDSCIANSFRGGTLSTH